MNPSYQNDFQKPTYNGQPPMATGIPTAPPPPSYQTTTPGLWSSGLLGCFSDVPICCMTCWCPCITAGQIADIVEKGSTSCTTAGSLYLLLDLLTGCGCMYSCLNRTKMRQQYNLAEKPCGDCMVHFFCEACALCQESRELKHRGFDLSLGWHGNMGKQNGGIAMAPPTAFQGGMSRY